MKRTIEISTRGLHLSGKQKQLRISEGESLLGKVPFEDIGVLILDSTELSVTTHAITSALERGVAIVFCGKNHHPEGMLLPLSSNTVHQKRFQAQIKASRPLKKNIWKAIVQSKVRCQGALLPDGPEKTRLKVLQESVGSGDPKNSEAQAARTYWPALFGSSFRRDRYGDRANSLLNYGYIVLRAATARAITATGLAPALGVHHISQYNPFCLADDLMEPFRPWVDARVLELHNEGEYEITKESKQHLLQVLTDRIVLNGEEGPLFAAIERSAASLSKAYVTYAQDDNEQTVIEIAKSLILPQGFPQAA